MQTGFTKDERRAMAIARIKHRWDNEAANYGMMTNADFTKQSAAFTACELAKAFNATTAKVNAWRRIKAPNRVPNCVARHLLVIIDERKAGKPLSVMKWPKKTPPKPMTKAITAYELESARLKAGWSMNDLAARIGVSQRTAYAYARGGVPIHASARVQAAIVG